MRVPAIKAEWDWGAFRRAISVPRFMQGARIGLNRALSDLVDRYVLGFSLGGYDPETGAPGYWEPRKIPENVGRSIEAGLAVEAARRAKLGPVTGVEMLKWERSREKKLGRPVTVDEAKKQREKLEAKRRWTPDDMRKFAAKHAPSAKTRDGVTRRLRFDVDDAGKVRPGTVMVDTGRYRQSITKSPVSVDSTGSVAGYVGTNVPYAKYHEQVGNEKGFTEQKITGRQAVFLRALGFSGAMPGGTIRLPARRVFVMPPKWAAEYARMVETEMVSVLNGRAA